MRWILDSRVIAALIAALVAAVIGFFGIYYKTAGDDLAYKYQGEFSINARLYTNNVGNEPDTAEFDVYAKAGAELIRLVSILTKCLPHGLEANADQSWAILQKEADDIQNRHTTDESSMNEAYRKLEETFREAHCAKFGND